MQNLCKIVKDRFFNLVKTGTDLDKGVCFIEEIDIE